MAWNRAHVNDPAHEASALQWAVIAMCDSTGRLSTVRAQVRPQALAVVGEAVWWVTIVDATLVRHYPETYDSALASRTADERAKIEETLAGLRFVRNRIGLEADLTDFVNPRTAGNPAPRERGVGRWMWKPRPEPDLAALSPRGQAWERARYQAYQAQLAGHTISETFGRAASFLNATTAIANISDLAESPAPAPQPGSR